jgi:hypothetical protein
MWLAGKLGWNGLTAQAPIINSAQKYKYNKRKVQIHKKNTKETKQNSV